MRTYANGSLSGTSLVYVGVIYFRCAFAENRKRMIRRTFTAHVMSSHTLAGSSSVRFRAQLFSLGRDTIG